VPNPRLFMIILWPNRTTGESLPLGGSSVCLVASAWKNACQPMVEFTSNSIFCYHS